MINCLPALILCPSFKLFCFLIPCAVLLGVIVPSPRKHKQRDYKSLGDVVTNEKTNFEMATDEDKSKLVKLLQEIEVPEVKLTERCSDLVKEFHRRFDKEVEEEMEQEVVTDELVENPYRPDPRLLEENERKLNELLTENKRVKKEFSENIVLTGQDPKRPWRTHSNKEKLHRIDGELKRHLEKSSQLIVPLADDDMKKLVKECQEETRAAPPVGINRLIDTVDAAKKNLPNFKYKKIDNTTATAILSVAHELNSKNSQAKTSLKLKSE